jgi:hypothetical protein
LYLSLSAEVAERNYKKHEKSTKKSLFDDSVPSLSPPDVPQITAIVDQSRQLLEPFNSDLFSNEVRIFNRPNGRELSDFQLFYNAVIQFKDVELFNFIRSKFSRNMLSDDDFEKILERFTEIICNLLNKKASEFVHKVIILVQRNIFNPSVNLIFEFMKQNFELMSENNQKQFELLLIKIIFDYRNNLLISFKINVIEF